MARKMILKMSQKKDLRKLKGNSIEKRTGYMKIFWEITVTNTNREKRYRIVRT